MSRSALTLIELVVVLVIIGLLVGLLLPAVQLARESARRLDCAARLRQTGVAIHSYHGNHQMFPPGNSRGFSVHVAILPYIGEQSLFDSVNYAAGGAVPEGIMGAPDPGSSVRAHTIELYLCPSDVDAFAPHGDRGTSYAGNSGTGAQQSGWNGLFRPLSKVVFDFGPLSERDVSDGLAQTAAISEILVANQSHDALRTIWDVRPRRTDPDEFAAACREHLGKGFNDPRRGIPWTHGDIGVTRYNHVLVPNSKSCMNAGTVQIGIYSAASLHKRGVNVLFADSHVSFVSDSVAADVWRALGSRNGGETAAGF